MVTSTKVTKIRDKLTKIDERFEVYMYDNGFMIEASGRNGKDDYVTTKILCSSLDEVLALVTEASEMVRSN